MKKILLIILTSLMKNKLVKELMIEVIDLAISNVKNLLTNKIKKEIEKQELENELYNRNLYNQESNRKSPRLRIVSDRS